jgi:hypothetical protein
MSLYTANPSGDCPAVVCQQLHSLDCQNFLHYNSLVFFPILGPLLVQGFILKEDLQFSKGVFTLKCTGKRFIHCTAPPLQNLKEALNMPPGMYCHYVLYTPQSNSAST